MREEGLDRILSGSGVYNAEFCDHLYHVPSGIPLGGRQVLQKISWDFTGQRSIMAGIAFGRRLTVQRTAWTFCGFSEYFICSGAACDAARVSVAVVSGMGGEKIFVRFDLDCDNNAYREFLCVACGMSAVDLETCLALYSGAVYRGE